MPTITKSFFHIELTGPSLEVWCSLLILWSTVAHAVLDFLTWIIV